MDSFEHVIASILERKGYWTRTAVKVDLTTEDKKAINRPSSPRWELDVVGYKGKDNHLLVLECKSFLDSSGVRTATFTDVNPKPKDEARYKLFFGDKLREIVISRLKWQLANDGFCAPNPKITFGLAAGRVYGDEGALERFFKEKGWDLWTPRRIRDELSAFGDSKYENSIAAVVAKILLRKQIGDEKFAAD